MHRIVICQAAETLTCLPKPSQTLISLAKGDLELTELDGETLWQLYDWLDSASFATYRLSPLVQTALRESGYVPPD